MKPAAIALTLTLAFLNVAAAEQTGQPGALSNRTQKLQSELLISSLATADLTTQITAEKGTIEHKSEVTRGGPVAAVVRTAGCEKASGDLCRVNADVIVYRPDGSVFHQVKNLDLPQGRAAVPLTVDDKAVTGVYRVVATIRDLTGRHIATLERQFGVK